MNKILALIFLLVATLAFAVADKYISSSGDLVLKTAVSKKVNLNDTLYTTQDNKVGVLLSLPSDYLDVRSATNGAGITVSGPTVSAGGSQPSIVFKRYSSGVLTTKSLIWGEGSGSSGAVGSSLHFATAPTGSSTSPVDRMMIDHNGYVGIGGIIPSDTLDIKGNIQLTNSANNKVGGIETVTITANNSDIYTGGRAGVIMIYDATNNRACVFHCAKATGGCVVTVNDTSITCATSGSTGVVCTASGSANPVCHSYPASNITYHIVAMRVD